eukprot:272490-Chlamydomonas_euryale.AAC.1
MFTPAGGSRAAAARQGPNAPPHPTRPGNGACVGRRACKARSYRHPQVCVQRYNGGVGITAVLRLSRVLFQLHFVYLHLFLPMLVLDFALHIPPSFRGFDFALHIPPSFISPASALAATAASAAPAAP